MALSLLCGLIAGTFSGAGAVDGKAINGRAVSVNWRYAPLNWGLKYQDADGSWCGSVDLFTISAGKVVRTDTIFSRSKGLCASAAFNLCGTKVAFYRLGRAGSTSGQAVSANGGTTTISVMDINGSNVTNLCTCPAEPQMGGKGGNGGLDWPAGDWIYYLLPKTGGGSMNEVWKVNVTTKENTRVCTFDLGGGRFRRWSLDLAADRMGCQVIDGSWFTSDVGPFPNGCSITTRSGNCNSAISASGNYQAKFNGNHTELCLSLYPGVSGIKAPPTNINLGGGPFTGVVLYQFQALTSDSFGNDVEGLAWAVNSDKWVLQHVGWWGHADMTGLGTEQVACNWSDMATIRISNNGKLARETCPAYGIPGPDCCGGCGTVYLGNTAGDLWVDGGPDNAGKYEDASGVWHSVPGWTGTCPYTRAADVSAHRDIPRALTAMIDAMGNIRAGGWTGGPALVRLVDIRGKTVWSAAMMAMAAAPVGTLRPGTYLLTVRQGAMTGVANVTVAR
jgi:hypothetical protein